MNQAEAKMLVWKSCSMMFRVVTFDELRSGDQVWHNVIGGASTDFVQGPFTVVKGENHADNAINNGMVDIPISMFGPRFELYVPYFPNKEVDNGRSR